MANTFSQIYLHVIFAVEGRQSLIEARHNDRLQKYITGIVTHQDQKLIAINNMPDHMHLLIGLKPTVALSDLVAVIKRDSSMFINSSKVGIGPIFVAGRLWSILVFPFAARDSHSLYPESATAPSETHVPAGVSGLPATVQNRERYTPFI